MGFASGVALTRGPDYDLAGVDVRRQGQQPVDAIRDCLGFEQFTELGDALFEIFRRVAGNVLEFTKHDAGHGSPRPRLPGPESMPWRGLSRSSLR